MKTMIKFFRRIRQKLLSENKFSKYLFYAIGEILLVVIGILLALQINNWNETSKNRTNEVKILTNLHVDFESTINNLNKATKEYSGLKKRLEAVINFIGFDFDKIPQGMIDTMRQTHVPIIDIIDGSLNAILNSEQLSLITGDSLKLLLTEYPSYVKRFKEQEKNMEDVLLTLHRPILERYVSLIDVFSKPEHSESFPNLKNRDPTSDYVGLIKDHDYQNVLFIQRGHILGSDREANKLLLKTEKLIELIERELEIE